MARTLTSTQQTLLASNPYRVERLIEIQTPAGSYYYTTGQHDVSVETDTQGIKVPRAWRYSGHM